MHVYFLKSATFFLYSKFLWLETRSQYLSEKLNYIDAASFLNSLPEGSLTYVVGDQRSYYYNKPVLVTPAFSQNPLALWANEAASPEDLNQQLKARGITHLLVNNSEFKRLDIAYHIFPFTLKGQANWDALRTREAKRIYRDNHCEVFLL